MPVVDASTGQPLSDDPDQEDERLRGGRGRGSFVSATDGPPEGSGVVTGPNNPREAEPGATEGEGPDLSGSNSTGGV
ncbi:MAG TPA: hypothetical protein VG455_04320 [Acidimicrobiales bacterium]|nr:hypothetical protein [Acidimicrobiales bacterium]